MAGNINNLDEQAKMEMVAGLEIEMMTDMYNRMTNVCQKKCIPAKYREAELNKGESICIDRCVAKYLEVHDQIGKRLTALSMQDDAANKRA
ncbi:Mitochondrial import inner membrane translocase subunit Tim10 [Trichoplax sp. H2]|uniref:Mitochondrial import inner membrane translocase subunit n=1 Tax=Trichoplax adhaerens TaxID=10228 RepID=B3RJD4_TRIAD|nr:hypothetical protein TRIADDRAFT_18962 [Trichoplax adhaerens]EDV28509.1 hypothetical protein TRIADDRAFT_18962 [Trichoplax adhaerens]RDD42885.1 Mitochondrial import inner membrane translocase subunit Tim10 [Trichoplax sp. H2]|eukprot:XP_002107711.1 hypothetical protein TRIADDRAFT_18962 [Trichoplax adhaerens]